MASRMTTNEANEDSPSIIRRRNGENEEKRERVELSVSNSEEAKKYFSTKDENRPSESSARPFGQLCKFALLFAMSLNYSILTLLIYYTRNKREGPAYLPSTLAFLSELVKLFVTIVALIRQTKSGRNLLTTIYNELVNEPLEFFKILIPAFLYSVPNQLIFIALQYIDPATYQVSMQLKILTTALFMYLMLNKRLTLIKWFSLILLFFGVCTIYLKSEIIFGTLGKTKYSDYAIGLTIVLVCCICSSLAGVYFEKILKESKCSFWVRNLQMYIWGLISVGFNIYFKDYEIIVKDGFFQGYTISVWILLVVVSIGGLAASLVIKHLDNNFKSLSVGGGVLMAGYGSYLIFRTEFQPQFFVGSVCVLSAIFLYSFG